MFAYPVFITSSV